LFGAWSGYIVGQQKIASVADVFDTQEIVGKDKLEWPLGETLNLSKLK
jgi:hypothetical protein